MYVVFVVNFGPLDAGILKCWPQIRNLCKKYRPRIGFLGLDSKIQKSRNVFKLDQEVIQIHLKLFLIVYMTGWRMCVICVYLVFWPCRLVSLYKVTRSSGLFFLLCDTVVPGLLLRFLYIRGPGGQGMDMGPETAEGPLMISAVAHWVKRIETYVG